MELVESVDDVKSSRSFRGTCGPDFELLDARVASALNTIIQNTRFKKKVSLEEMNAQKLSRITRTYLQLLFEMMIFRNCIRKGTKFY